MSPESQSSQTNPDFLPKPATEPQTIELDPPTAHVLMKILDKALQNDNITSEPYEVGALARLMSAINTQKCPKGTLTQNVKDNTLLNGIPGQTYQIILFDHYEDQTGISPP